MIKWTYKQNSNVRWYNFVFCIRLLYEFSFVEACLGDSGAPMVMDKEKPEKVVAVYVAGSNTNIGACGTLPRFKGIVEKLTHPVINFWIKNFP